MKYRTKPMLKEDSPIVVEAKQLADPETPESIAEWCGGRVVHEPHTGGGPACHLIFPTSMGEMKARPGSYIVKSPVGDLLCYKPEVFFLRYEEINDDT